uniref:Transmembrane protein 41B n=1 Tax=Cacopsylla melanoneura TaxID=428564 RepID=A0A8D9A3Y2_9HEMI
MCSSGTTNDNHHVPVGANTTSDTNGVPPPVMTATVEPLPSESTNRTAVVRNETSTLFSIVALISIFLLTSVMLVYIYFNFPTLNADEKKFIKLPWNITDAQNLGRVLEKHKDQHKVEVFVSLVFVYIFLQSFAIPGSIFLSILSGFLYPFPVALSLVCFCSATGASVCYLISFFLGRGLVYKFFPEQAAKYASLVLRHKHNLFSYILFLRVTPFLPNWFINIAAPVVDVPIMPFYFGTFIGVAPPSFVAIQAGKTLQQMSSTSGTWSWGSVALLAVFAVISLVPIFIKKRLREKFD